MPILDRMAGVRTKLERAREHLAALDTEASQFTADAPFRIRDERPEPFHYIGILVLKRLPPIRWAAIAGDIVHNLRAALDHIAWQLVEANGGTPDRWTHFPVSLTSEHFADKGRKGLGGASERAIDLIGVLQPFGAPTPQAHSLHLLHELDIRDKHRLLNMAAAARLAVATTVD